VIWGNSFRDLGPSNGGVGTPRSACSRAGGGCGRRSPPPAERVRGCYPRNFFFIDFWCQRPCLGGNLGQKINWSRVSLTSTTWFAGTLQCKRSTCGQRYLPERRSGSKILAGTAFPHHYTPGNTPMGYYVKTTSSTKLEEYIYARSQKCHLIFLEYLSQKWINLSNFGSHSPEEIRRTSKQCCFCQRHCKKCGLKTQKFISQQ